MTDAALPEGTETIVLALQPGTGYAATATVSDNDLVDRVPVSSAGGAVRVLASGSATSLFTITPFGGYNSPVSVATGDVTGDRVEDVIVGTASASFHVKVFDGATGQLVRSFLAFPGFAGGVNVAAGDLNGDGRADVIAATASGASHVKAFDAATGGLVRSFLAFDGFGGGVSVAASEGGRTSSSETARGAAHIKAFDAAGRLAQSFLAFGLSPVGSSWPATLTGTERTTSWSRPALAARHR